MTTCSIVEVHLNESNGIVASKISINSNSSRMAVIDTSSVLRLFDLSTKVQKDELANFKRTDVWNIVWATDNPNMFVSMEKIKMYIFRDTQPEVRINLFIEKGLRFYLLCNIYIYIICFRSQLLVLAIFARFRTFK